MSHLALCSFRITSEKRRVFMLLIFLSSCQQSHFCFRLFNFALSP